MKKIYSIFGGKAPIMLLAASLISAVAFSQPACGNVAENFNSTGGTTAGFTGDFMYAATGGNGYLQKASVIGSAVYTITTPTYQLPASATNIGFGFLLGGTRQVARIEVSVTYRSTLNGEITSFFIGQFVPSYDNTTPPTAGFCRSVAVSDLPGFPSGGLYRFSIDLTPGLAFGGVSETITFDDFSTNGTLSLIPLPVNFIGIEARKAASGVQVTWKVAGEENIARYEIERSADGRSFTKVATATKTGLDTYTYLDNSISTTTVYYRIKNVDNDGSFKYSSVARYSNGRSEIVLKAFPQPVSGKVTLQHPAMTGNSLFTISTADGRQVKWIKPANGSIQTSVDMTGLQAGLYLIRLDAGNGTAETLKIIKQ